MFSAASHIATLFLWALPYKLEQNNQNLFFWNIFCCHFLTPQNPSICSLSGLINNGIVKGKKSRREGEYRRFKSGKEKGKSRGKQRFPKAKTSIPIGSTLHTLRTQQWKNPDGSSSLELSTLAAHCLESLLKGNDARPPIWDHLILLVWVIRVEKHWSSSNSYLMTLMIVVQTYNLIK